MLAELSHLDLSWNKLEDLTSLTANTNLGSASNHVIDLSNNMLDGDDCLEIQTFSDRANASGAALTTFPQGRFESTGLSGLWAPGGDLLCQWVDDINSGTYQSKPDCTP